MKPVLAWLLCLASFTLTAQRYYLPGYVVRLDGDSLKGFVNYNLSAKGSRQCFFRPTKKGDDTRYSSQDILAYGFTGDKVFVTKLLPPDTALSEKVFVEELVRGKASLFRKGKDFYIEKDSLYALEVENNVVLDRNVYYAQQKKKYAGTLNYLFLDCAGLSDKIMAVAYRESSLVKITRDYNQCVGANYHVFKEKNANFTTDVYFVTGWSFTSFEFRTHSYPLIFEKNPRLKDSSPFVGAGIRLNDRRSIEKLYIQLEVQFMRNTYEDEDALSNSAVGAFAKQEYSISYSKFKVPIGLKYHLISGPFSPYIIGGYCLNFISNGQLDLSIEYANGGQEIRVDENLTSYKGHQFWGGVGVQKRFDKMTLLVEGRMEGLGNKSNAFILYEDGSETVIDGYSIRSPSFSLNLGIGF